MGTMGVLKAWWKSTSEEHDCPYCGHPWFQMKAAGAPVAKLDGCRVEDRGDDGVIVCNYCDKDFPLPP